MCLACCNEIKLAWLQTLLDALGAGAVHILPVQTGGAVPGRSVSCLLLCHEQCTNNPLSYNPFEDRKTFRD